MAIATAGCSRPAVEQTPAPAASAPSAAAPADPYHPPPRDTVDAATYEGWKQYSLQCARCHGDEARGSSFAPSLVQALTPDGSIGTEARFRLVVADGRPDKGMPAAAKLGIDSLFFSPLYRYLKGRSDGILHPGRPARRDR